jgi:hypothetical protein
LRSAYHTSGTVTPIAPPRASKKKKNDAKARECVRVFPRKEGEGAGDPDQQSNERAATL